MPRRLPLFAVLVAGLSPMAPGAYAADALPGPVQAELLRVVDGDTLELRVRIWLDQDLVVKARLAGVDAPELTRPGCPAERALAEQARDLVAREAGSGNVLILTGVEHDKYAGRVVATVRTGAGRDLGEILIAAGLAEIYGEGRDWCALS